MTTQREMIVIAKNVISDLNKIENYMVKYDKLKIAPANWGTAQFAAYEFIEYIKEEINKINLALSVYTRPDLQHIYANKNYDGYVNEIKKNLKMIQKRFDNFKEYEYKHYYIPLSDKEIEAD